MSDGVANYILKATDDTAAAFNSVNKRVDETSRNMANIGEAMAKAASVMATATAAVVAGMVYITKQTSDAVDAQAELATALRTSYNSLTNLGLIGKVVGVDVSTMNTSVMKLNDSIADLARGGTGDAAKKLRELGLTAEQLSALDADQRIATIAERIKEVVPAAQQAAFAVDILGRTAGQALLQIDSAKVADAATQAERFGVALSDMEVQKIAQVADSMDTINLAMGGIGNSVALSMAPIFAETARQITGAADAMEGFRNVGIGVRSVLVNIVALVADVADVISLPFRAAGYTIETVFANIFAAITRTYTNLIHGINAIPGINLDAHEKAAGRLAKSAETAAGLAGKRLSDLFASDLWGNQLRDWVIEVDVASMKAASIAAENARKVRDEMANGNGAPVGDTGKPDEKAKEIADLSAHLDERNRVIREHLWMSEEDESELKRLRARDEIAEANRRAKDKETAAARKKKDREDTFAGTRDMLNNLSVLMNSSSRKAFEVGKAAAIGETLMNTYASATGAYKSLVSIPFVGPALAAAAAASAVIAGMANVQSIRSQQFGGGGGSAPAVPSVTSATSAAIAPVQSAPTLPTSSQSGGPQRQTTIIVESGNAMLDVWIRDKLAPAMRQAHGDGITFITA